MSVPALHYEPDFLSPAQAAAVFRTLLDEVVWQRETLRLYGRPVEVPRLLAWCGDQGINYRYSGRDHPCAGWFPALSGLRDRIRAELGLPTNLVLLNRYRTGRDYMGWHRDDETGLGATVAALSLGARRRLLVRPPGSRRSRPLDLEPGSLLLMDGALRHSLPRTARPVGERLSLTFRCVAAPA